MPQARKCLESEGRKDRLEGPCDEEEEEEKGMEAWTESENVDGSDEGWEREEVRRASLIHWRGREAAGEQTSFGRLWPGRS